MTRQLLHLKDKEARNTKEEQKAPNEIAKNNVLNFGFMVTPFCFLLLVYIFQLLKPSLQLFKPQDNGHELGIQVREKGSALLGKNV